MLAPGDAVHRRRRPGDRPDEPGPHLRGDVGSPARAGHPHLRRASAPGLFRSDDGGDTWKRLDNVTSVSAGDISGLTRNRRPRAHRRRARPEQPRPGLRDHLADRRRRQGLLRVRRRRRLVRTAARPGSQGGFGWWFGRLWVDPRNQEHLFVAGVNLRESSDRRQHLGQLRGLHADQHAMQWDPAVANRVWLGNDGGLYRSDANGADATWTKAIHEPYTQHYQVEVGRDRPERGSPAARRTTAASGPGASGEPGTATGTRTAAATASTRRSTTSTRASGTAAASTARARATTAQRYRRR